MNLGPAIKRVRIRLGISQVELADRLGSSAAYIGDVEDGRKGMSIKRWAEICRALGVLASDVVLEAEKEGD